MVTPSGQMHYVSQTRKVNVEPIALIRIITQSLRSTTLSAVVYANSRANLCVLCLCRTETGTGSHPRKGRPLSGEHVKFMPRLRGEGTEYSVAITGRKGLNLPEGERMATCSKCGGPIKFKKLPSGKWCPASVSGGDHWDECREWQNVGKYGIKVVRVNMIGPVWTPGHGTKAHAKKIGLNPDCCCIPFDPPYNMLVDFP